MEIRVEVSRIPRKVDFQSYRICRSRKLGEALGIPGRPRHCNLLLGNFDGAVDDKFDKFSASEILRFFFFFAFHRTAHRTDNLDSRSSLAAPDYDVPRPRLPASSLPSRHNTPIPKTPTPPPPPPPSTQQIYDVPVSKELPLELDSALEGLQRLQSEASAAIARLLGFVSPGWRTPQRLDATLMDLRLAALRLRTSLHDLAEFAEGDSLLFSLFAESEN